MSMRTSNELLKMRKSFNEELTQEFEVEITTRVGVGGAKVDVIVAANDDKFVIKYHSSPSSRNCTKMMKSQHRRVKTRLKKSA